MKVNDEKEDKKCKDEEKRKREYVGVDREEKRERDSREEKERETVYTMV